MLNLRRRTLLAMACLGVVSCRAPVPDQLTSDFDFNKHAFTFENFDDTNPDAQMSVALAVRMFGAAAVCKTQNNGECQANDLTLAFIREVNQTLHAGHSEGMARMALLLQLGALNASDFGAENAATMSAQNSKVLQEIVYWSATQKVPTALVGESSYEAKDVMPFLAKILKPGEKEAYRLAIAMKTELGFAGGHSLVPFGYFKGETEGQYFLRVYDNNMPAKEQRLLIDTKANTWSYEGSPDPAKPLPYSGNGDDHNRLYFSPVTARMGVLQAPFADDAKALAISTQGVEVTASDSTGAEVGVRDGKVFENGGTVRPGFAACLCQAPHEIVNITLSPDGGMGGTQTVAVGRVGQYEADGGTVNITAPGLTSTVEGVHSVGNQTVSVTGKTLTYNSNGNDGETIKVTSTVKQPDGSTTKVTVTVNQAGDGVTIDATDPKNVKVTVNGTGATAAVTVSNTTASGDTKTTTSQFTTGAMGGSSTVNTDTNTSTIVKSTYVPPCQNSVKDGTETDVDCGLTCVMATGSQFDGGCANGLRCQSDDDCRTRICGTNGVCRGAGCDDGKRNQDETDVDCGGTTCGKACAEGKRCLLDRDCPAGVRCFNPNGTGGQCLAQGTKYMHVIGLGASTYTYLNGSTIDGQSVDFGIRGQDSADFMVPFKANTYYFYDNGTFRQLPMVTCSPIENETNYDQNGIIADAGIPTLRCRVAYTELWLQVNANNCYGQPRFAYWFNGTLQPPFTYVPPAEGTNSTYTKLGTFQWSYSLVPMTSPVVYAGGNPEVCQLTAVSTGAPIMNNFASDRFTSAGKVVVTADCTCNPVPDAGVDAGLDAGVDAGRPDSGVDAGFDAGFDAGRPDSGVDAGFDAGFDAGVDAGPSTKPIGATCQLDSECTNLDCECGVNSGNCTGNSGKCGAGKIVFSTPTTDGVAASGTFTVPASCPSVSVAAWGAAGGSGYATMPTASYYPGGAGGHVSGTLTVSQGDVFTAWVGGSGTITSDPNWPLGKGSLAGTAANGGYGQAASGFGALIAGGGGGLTSVRKTGSSTVTFSVPAGGGGSMNGSSAGGEVGSGNASTLGGGNGTTFTSSGGGGAGENGGLGGTSDGMPGKAGAFSSSLPSGLTPTAGSGSTAPGTSNRNYTLCPSTTAAGAQMSSVGGNGCVVLRCVSP